MIFCCSSLILGVKNLSPSKIQTSGYTSIPMVKNDFSVAASIIGVKIMIKTNTSPI